VHWNNGEGCASYTFDFIVVRMLPLAACCMPLGIYEQLLDIDGENTQHTCQSSNGSNPINQTWHKLKHVGPRAHVTNLDRTNLACEEILPDFFGDSTVSYSIKFSEKKSCKTSCSKVESRNGT
jgi:hypothetical protein